jgi:hypothetical protein
VDSSRAYSALGYPDDDTFENLEDVRVVLLGALEQFRLQARTAEDVRP